VEPNNPHDSLVRSVFSDPKNAAGELRHILGADLSARFTWSTLAVSSGSFVDEALRGRHSDILFNVRCGTKDVLIYLLFEHKSTSERLTAFQVLIYLVRIWEHHLRLHPEAKRLPAILPLVLHHSEKGWTSPTSFHELLDLDDDTLPVFAQYLPSFRFLLDDISKERDEALRSRAMTALARLALFCLRHAREPLELVDALGRWLDLVREVHRAPGGREALARIWRYIFVVSNPAEPEDLVKRLVGVVGKESEEAMTVADWLELKGARSMLLRQLRTRFGEVPDDAMARVEAADRAQLDTWADRLFTALTLDDVLAQA
jgi:predicted transposase YdaD